MTRGASFGALTPPCSSAVIPPHGGYRLEGLSVDHVVTGDGPPPDLAAVRADPALIPTYAAIAASFAWTRGYLTGRGWLEWLARLPLEHHLTTPSGVRVLAVHAVLHPRRELLDYKQR